MENRIKDNWQNARFHRNSENNYSEIINGNRRTALENLARRYKRFSNLSMICLLYQPFLAFSRVFDFDGRVIVFSLAAIYFLVASVMDWWLYHRISRIDCSVMTINEVAVSAVFYRKRHLQFMAILIPLAILWVGLFAYFTTDNLYILYGILFGLLIGIAIGYRQFLEFMGDYRTLYENSDNKKD